MKKLLDQFIKVIVQQHGLIAIFLLALGIVFRLIYKENFGVGFDQIQILQNSHKILNKDLSLIGPRTGPADMFTGPLIYYITAPFVLFFGNYYAVFLVPLFISIVTGLSIYFISKKYLGKKKSLVLLAFWSASPFIVNLDRVFWNPNLMLLSSFLIFLPILAVIHKKQDKLTYLWLFLGSFLSYQAHFSGFILILLAILSIFILKKELKLLSPIVIGIIISITPTLIFDIRNNFLNLRGLISLFTNKGEVNIFRLVGDIYHNSYILVETMGKIFFFGNSTATIISAGLLIISLYLILSSKKDDFKFTILWLLFIATTFAFYKGEKPEYYFLISVPALFYLLTYLFSQANRYLQLLIFIFFLFNSTLINLELYKTNSGISNGIINEIKEYLQDKKVKSIIYDVPYGSEIGIQYILSEVEIEESGDIYHISFPNNLSFNGVTKFSNTGVWSDSRSSIKNYISKNNHFIETPKDKKLFADLYPKNEIQDFDTYQYVDDNKIVGTLLVANESKDKLDWVQECLKLKMTKKPSWEKLNDSSYIKYQSTHCLKYSIVEKTNVNLDDIRLY